MWASKFTLAEELLLVLALLCIFLSYSMEEA